MWNVKPVILWVCGTGTFKLISVKREEKSTKLVRNLRLLHNYLFMDILLA